LFAIFPAHAAFGGRQHIDSVEPLQERWNNIVMTGTQSPPGYKMKYDASYNFTKIKKEPSSKLMYVVHIYILWSPFGR
jgi:hypothetical protein